MKNLVILYDTDCGFCDWTRDVIEKYDPENQFEFISIGSPEALLLAHSQNKIINQDDPESFVLHDTSTGDWFEKADAGFEISKRCSGILFLFSRLLLITPRFISNRIYRLVAKNRAKLGPMVGRNTCRIR